MSFIPNSSNESYSNQTSSNPSGNQAQQQQQHSSPIQNQLQQQQSSQLDQTTTRVQDPSSYYQLQQQLSNYQQQSHHHSPVQIPVLQQQQLYPDPSFNANQIQRPQFQQPAPQQQDGLSQPPIPQQPLHHHSYFQQIIQPEVSNYSHAQPIVQSQSLSSLGIQTSQQSHNAIQDSINYQGSPQRNLPSHSHLQSHQIQSQQPLHPQPVPMSGLSGIPSSLQSISNNTSSVGATQPSIITYIQGSAYPSQSQNSSAFQNNTPSSEILGGAPGAVSTPTSNPGSSGAANMNTNPSDPYGYLNSSIPPMVGNPNPYNNYNNQAMYYGGLQMQQQPQIFDVQSSQNVLQSQQISSVVGGSANSASHIPNFNPLGPGNRTHAQQQFQQPMVNPIYSTMPPPPIKKPRKRRHTATVHDMTPETAERNRCRICNKQFKRPSSLQTHYYSHTGEKIFKCPWPDCGKLFSVKSNMTRHYRLHERDANKDLGPHRDDQQDGFNPSSSSLGSSSTTTNSGIGDTAN
ncbi:uncharacterized protein RJT21DRAFT_111689 [Scheffersomyces amazonensis]|uniref:uncharacterized protein n=1 Tax=Scheffersomyces amazonensis TaxID=1078765 RepID=UPI00315CB1D4